MAQIFLIGWVSADLRLRMSARNVPYIRFDMVEVIGHGEHSVRQSYQVWAFGSESEHLAKQNVKKGSLMWVSGSLVLTDYLKKDGVTRDKVLKITFKDGGYVPGQRTLPPIPAQQPAEPVTVFPPGEERIDGERDPLPE